MRCVPSKEYWEINHISLIQCAPRCIDLLYPSTIQTFRLKPHEYYKKPVQCHYPTVLIPTQSLNTMHKIGKTKFSIPNPSKNQYVPTKEAKMNSQKRLKNDLEIHPIG